MTKSEVAKSLVIIGSMLFGSSVVAAVYIYWTSKKSSKAITKGNVPGLCNIGNTCYINCLLQSLASSDCTLRWLEGLPTQDMILVVELHRILNALNTTEETVYNAEGIIHALSSHNWCLGNQVEQDCYELLTVLVSSLEEELHSKPARADINTVSREVLNLQAAVSENEVARDKQLRSAYVLTELKTASAEQKTLSLPFHGLIATRLQCRNCGFKYVRHDNFCSLQLALPKHDLSSTIFRNDVSLLSCLRKYFASEICELNCSKCSSHSDISQAGPLRSSFIRKQGISKLPSCLVLHIQRAAWLPSGNVFKMTDPVSFPERLDIRDFIFYRSKSEDYLLSKEKQPKIADSKLTYSAKPSGDMLISNFSLSLPNQDAPVIVGGSASEGKPVVHVKSATSTESATRNNHAPDKLKLASAPPSQLARRYIYNLVSVINHLGAIDSGHFVTYRRGIYNCEDRDNWYYTSDSLVKRTSLRHVLESEAYMLVYERLG